MQIAYRLFLSKGYEETSIDEIIAEAQIAKGTFYYHFKSKEALLEALINKMITEKAEQAKKFYQLRCLLLRKLLQLLQH